MSGQNSNFGDDGGSIMDQINALFAPPGGDTVKVTTVSDNAELHPYFKRPGRGHNHDNCDSCGEGGDLICCDSCPSSFHFQCHDPPLEDKDIPEGDWICIKCFSSYEKNMKLVAEAKKQRAAEEKAFKPVKVKSKPKVVHTKVVEEEEPEVEAAATDTDWKPAGKGKAKKVANEVVDTGRSSRPSRGVRQKYDEQFEEDIEESMMVLEEEKIEKVLKLSARAKIKTYRELYIDHLAMREEKTNTMFDSLLAVVRSTSGEEFQMPAKMTPVAEKFPYSWKWSEPKKGKARPDEDLFEPRGQVKFCYVCVKSSRLGPLVQCDYCSSAFHMDCLDPPLSEIPRDVWMCPNHVENFLDSKLLNTTSITKRLELWEKYAKRPLDQNSVKIAFLNRAHRKVPPYKRKVLAASIRRVSVPKFIKDIYANPRPLIPGPGYEHWLDPVERGVTARQIKASRGNTSNTNLTDANNENEMPGGDTEDRLAVSGREDEMEWVAGLVSLQTDILKGKIEKSKDTLLVRENQTKHNASKVEGGNEFNQNNTTMERDSKEEHNDLATKINKELIIHNEMEKVGNNKPEGWDRNAKKYDKVQNNAINKMEEGNGSLENTDLNIKVEDFEKDSSEEKDGDLQIRSPGESTISGRSLSPRFTDPDNFSGLTTKLHEYLMSHGKEAALLNPTILQYLATKQYESMFSSELSSSSRISEVASRAALAPIGSRKTPAYMKYRSLVIGTGGDCQMNLSSYGHCNYVSAKHATIFYDELSDQYELINYSEFGSLVDNCLYTLDTLSITSRKDIVDESAKLKKR